MTFQIHFSTSLGAHLKRAEAIIRTKQRKRTCRYIINTSFELCSLLIYSFPFCLCFLVFFPRLGDSLSFPWWWNEDLVGDSLLSEIQAGRGSRGGLPSGTAKSRSFGSFGEGVNLLSFLGSFTFPQGFFGTNCIFQMILSEKWGRKEIFWTVFARLSEQLEPQAQDTWVCLLKIFSRSQ